MPIRVNARLMAIGAAAILCVMAMIFFHHTQETVPTPHTSFEKAKSTEIVDIHPPENLLPPSIESAALPVPTKILYREKIVKEPSSTVFKTAKPPPYYERNMTHYKPSEVLLNFVGNAPDTIHVIWCGKKWFEFKHYLSMLSVFKVQQPNKLVLHYWSGAAIMWDRNDYNLWWKELTHEYYNIVSRSMPGDSPSCLDEDAMTKVIFDVLKNGGIYVNETLMLHQPLHHLRNAELTVAVADRNLAMTYSNIGFMIAKAGKATQENLQSLEAEHILSCEDSDDLPEKVQKDKPSSYPACVRVVKNSHPERHMIAGDAWSYVVRNMVYGSPLPRHPRWSMDNAIPDIGHMVLLGGYEMNMLTYLSIRSMIHCVGSEAMYIYIDVEPRGQWYEKLKAEEPRAIFVYHEWPGSVFGVRMQDGSHASDLMRFDLIYRYGGIYVDWDAVMLKNLGYLRGYDFVTDFDWPDWHPPYPDVINNGVSAGKKGSEYLRMALHKFETYDPDGDWYYNGLMMPYKLYEKYPELVKIERKLQVICYNFLCHPVWLPNYHDEKVSHLNGSPFDWREVYAFHWTRPSPPELLDYEKMMNTTSMFAEVGRHILTCKYEETRERIRLEEEKFGVHEPPRL